jgi:hypothetical protein
LADEIERTVARGVVDTEQETDFYPKKSTMLRPMTDEEKLATGLEFLITAAEVPLMLHKAQSRLGNRPITWLPERPGTQREEVVESPIGDISPNTIRDVSELLAEIIKEMGELEIQFPDVA